MFAFIKNAFKKEVKVDVRVARWMDKRETLIAEKWRLVEVAEVLTDRTYDRAMKAIRRKIDRVTKLLILANVAV